MSLEAHFVVPFERSFDAHYGLEYLSAGDGEARGRVVVRAEHLGAGGSVGSGVYAAMAESLASTGTAVEVVPQGCFPSGLSAARSSVSTRATSRLGIWKREALANTPS